MTPMHMYRCKMVLPNEAVTMATPHIIPPAMTTGRLPCRFTRMLLKGPEENRKRMEIKGERREVKAALTSTDKRHLSSKSQVNPQTH